MANYKLSEEAHDDLYRIWLYGLEHWGLEAADDYFNAFFKRFDDIANNPFQYASADDIKVGYRRSVCGVDNIYYRMNDDSTVEITAIIGQQDSEQWL